MRFAGQRTGRDRVCRDAGVLFIFTVIKLIAAESGQAANSAASVRKSRRRSMKMCVALANKMPRARARATICFTSRRNQTHANRE